MLTTATNAKRKMIALFMVVLVDRLGKTGSEEGTAAFAVFMQTCLIGGL